METNRVTDRQERETRMQGGGRRQGWMNGPCGPATGETQRWNAGAEADGDSPVFTPSGTGRTEAFQGMGATSSAETQSRAGSWPTTCSLHPEA